MAWHRSTKSSKIEPSAEEWGRRVNNSQGKKHSILDYSSTVHTESRMSQTGRRYGFVRVPVPPQINLFIDPADVFDEHSNFPPIAAYGLPKKAEGFFPMERLPWNSAGYKNQSPFSWDNNDDHSTGASAVDNDECHGGYGDGGSYSPDYCMGSPKGGGGGGKPSFVRPAGRHQQYTAPWSKPETDAQSPKAGWKPMFEPPPGARHPQYTAPWSKPETDAQSTKAGNWKPLFEPPPGARHPQYSASVPASPKKDMRYETAHNRPIGAGPPRSKPEADTDYYAVESPKARQQASFVPDYYAPDTTPPKKDAYYGTTNNRPIGAGPPRSKPEADTDYYATESPKARQQASFVPDYYAPDTTPPKKDAHYGTTNNRPIVPGPPRSKPETDTGYAMESPKAYQNASFVPSTGKHPDHYAPDTTPPKKDAYYGTTNNRPIVPSPLQSKLESGSTGYASDSPKAGSFGSPSERRPQHTIPVKEPYYGTTNNSKPSHDNIDKGMTRENRETIDSREARKRYGGKSSKQQPPEEEHVGIIDCREAARKYNGIFVP